eukprot:scaffold17378_cov78-Phaeocystis_antarctica.AAC.4
MRRRRHVKQRAMQEERCISYLGVRGLGLGCGMAWGRARLPRHVTHGIVIVTVEQGPDLQPPLRQHHRRLG